jgi:D-methionine transport system substrate-binding protein
MRKTILTPTRVAAIAGLAAATTLSLSGCGKSGDSADAVDNSARSSAGGFIAPSADDKGGKNNPIKVGIMTPDLQYGVLEASAQAEGIFVEWIEFSDYQSANPAVAQGEADINQFQHIALLAGFNVEAGERLVPLASTAIYPLSLFSEKYESVDEIPEGSKIAVPNDETNLARGIGVLAQAGLVDLKDGVDPLYVTPLDIQEGESKVEVVPVSADQTPRALEDPVIAGSIVNQHFAQDADLDPQSALASGDPNDPGSTPYVNIFAGKEEAREVPAITRLLELAGREDFKDAVLEQSKNSAVLVDLPYEDLLATLEDVEAQIRAHS